MGWKLLCLALGCLLERALAFQSSTATLGVTLRSRERSTSSSTSVYKTQSAPWVRATPLSALPCRSAQCTAKTRLPSRTTRACSIRSWSTAKALSEDSQGPSRLQRFQTYAQYFCNGFPIWTLITALIALRRPGVFLGVPPSTFPAQISILMLCMGISLKPADFQRVLQRPMAVLLAFVGCYGVMPGLAVLIGRLLQLSPSLAAGLVLVACINGAQASNLCTYIGQGDLALSVMMTTMTTIGAIVMTPLMGQWLLGQVVPVNPWAIARSTVEVVLGPILMGMFINKRFPKFVQTILPFTPVLGVCITCLLVGTSVAGCASSILNAGFKLQLSAALLHALGGVAGYVFTKPFYGEDVCRTFAIEFAMKSSAFGYLLATLHFSDFAVRVPSAVSIVWMTLIGSSLAVASRFFPPQECKVGD